MQSTPGTNSTSGIIYNVGERSGCVMKSSANSMSYQSYQGEISLSYIAWQCTHISSQRSAQHFGPENSDPCFLLYLVSHMCVNHTTCDYHSRLCFLLLRDANLVGLIYFQVLIVILQFSKQVLKRQPKTHSIVGLGFR